MKSEFSKTWNSSKQPRKQIKFRANAPNHIKRTFMGATLDKSLREKYGRRSIEVRKGDEVKIMRGNFKGKQGKVGVVDIKRTRIQVDGIQRTKKGGEKLETWFNPSKVKIIILNVEDKKRLKSGKNPVKTEIKETTTKKIPAKVDKTVTKSRTKK
ncbi:50S ribosomal protein L24 [Candidatus Pacearchaeota archaeon]|nr:50S ribosomal protein L24 [Candidatus Pacearchaeota archaeon]